MTTATLVATLVCTVCHRGWDCPPGFFFCPGCGSALHVETRDEHYEIPLRGRP